MGAYASNALLRCYEGTEELTIDGTALTYRSQVRGCLAELRPRTAFQRA